MKPAGRLRALIRRSVLPRSRPRRARLLTTALLVLAGLIIADRLGWLPARAAPDHDRYDCREFLVTKVVDGDTLDLQTPDPLAGKPYTRARLWGVDTPETHDPRTGVMYFGPEAADLAARLALGRRVLVLLEPHQKSRDKYGRLLAYIYLPLDDPNRPAHTAAPLSPGDRPDLPDRPMLNELLLQNGCAYADERFPHIFSQRFLRLQKQAQREKRGLWPQAQPQDWPDWYRRRHDPTFATPQPVEP